MTPSPGVPHQQISANLNEVLRPLDVIFSSHTVVQPDLIFVDGDAYRPVTSARGAEPVSLPPFPSLTIVPEPLWPA